MILQFLEFLMITNLFLVLFVSCAFPRGVCNIMEHSFDSSRILDTRAVAEAVFDAAKAYRRINDAIEGSLNTSIKALRVAGEAYARVSASTAPRMTFITQ